MSFAEHKNPELVLNRIEAAQAIGASPVRCFGSCVRNARFHFPIVASALGNFTTMTQTRNNKMKVK